MVLQKAVAVVVVVVVVVVVIVVVGVGVGVVVTSSGSKKFGSIIEIRPCFIWCKVIQQVFDTFHWTPAEPFQFMS